MLPALTTKPKQAVRQVKGLTNDSIDSYSNTPLGGGSGIGSGMTATYVDNTESGNGTARGSPPSSSRATMNTGRAANAKLTTNEEGATMARVVRDRKALGEEELSLRTGDIVKVLSSKRTGYLKCEVGDEVGYVPSSYLEFLDNSAETENGNSNAVSDESQRAAEKLRKKQQRKEKRKKEKREANDASDPEEGAPVSARSPRKEVPAEEEVSESPRKSKKKNRKHRDGEDTGRGAASGVDEVTTTARSRAASEDTERSRSKSKHSKKKRHRGVDSSDSSESDGAKRSGRHGRRRRHRRGSSSSDSDSTSSDDSDGSYRRRRRRRRHRHRRSSSEEDEDDSDYKRRSRRNKKRRDKVDGESEPEEGSRSARKAEKKKTSAALLEVEKGVSQLDVKADEKASEAKVSALSSKRDEPDRDRGKKEETERSEGSSEGRATNASTGRKDDEGRTSSSTSISSSQKQNGNSKSGLGRQIGEKMRSFLGGSKKQHSSKSSSGILNACPGTVQGEEGWYEHGENERYYFVLVDGKWSLLYGPMTEDDFEVFSNRVLEQNRSIELPPTYLHKTGYYLNRELRVQKEQ